MTIDHCCRAPQDDQDKFIFELFNLGHNKKNVDISLSKRSITKEELCVMMIDLPKNVVIVSKEKAQSNKDGPDSKKKNELPFSELSAIEKKSGIEDGTDI